MAFVCLYCFVSDTSSHYVAQTGLKLMILLPQPTYRVLELQGHNTTYDNIMDFVDKGRIFWIWSHAEKNVNY
jgi:hypothetical protein